MKLHLGCGERYFDGYHNIDFPPEDRAVQQNAVADEFADITKLVFKPGSIEEVRLHHLFEHFNRAQACALIASWNRWLRPGGTLRIEVPDFFRTSLAILSPFTSFHRKGVGIRHLFGSQEAGWALHYDGYWSGRLKFLLSLFGFGAIKIRRNSWRGTYNIETTARKQIESFTRENCMAAGERYLSTFCVDDSDSERLMLKVWMDDFAKQLDVNYK